MAKPTTKKTAAPEIAAPSRATRIKEKVLVQKTPAELKDLIGADTKIGVSRKELKLIVLKARQGDILSDLGI